MTTTPPEDADVPAALRPQWDELVETAPQMVAAHDEYERSASDATSWSSSCSGAGVRRRELEGVPFSPALLSRIRKREHIPTERRRRDAP
jgi:hypothetical protein